MENIELMKEEHMNKLFFLTILLFASYAQAAPSLFCEGHGEHEYGVPSQATLVTDNWMDLNCVNRKGEHYIVQLEGYGIGVQIQVNQYFVISCPLVRKSKLTTTTFYGVNVSASLVAGPAASLLSNKNLGVCTMVGVNLGIGAAVSFDSMKIYKD